MKLLCSYANSCSIDIDPKNQPNLPTQYFPIPADKYITIQNSSGQPAKDFDLWQEVINLIHPYLESAGIQIVQLGQGEIKPLNKVINLVNQTNFAQSCYILKNALLHCGNDSWAAHGCAEDVPCVILYGSTSVDAHSPYFYHPKSQFLSSHRWGRNCSFNPGENPKSVNLIDPFYVAAQILDILEIKHEIKSKSLFVGDGYVNGNIIEIIPDSVVNPNGIAPGNLALRADLLFSLPHIIENLKLRPYILFLDREIDLEILKQLKPNIPLILYEIDESTDINYLKKIQRLGIPLRLTTRIPADEHQKLKLNYLDLPLIERIENAKIEDVKNSIKKYLNSQEEPDLTKEYKFYSHKHYLSMRKIFPSLFSWRNQIPVENIDEFSRADFTNQDFLNEIQNFLIFS